MMEDTVPVYVDCFKEQAQNSEQMGEQGVQGGMAALSEPTSVCIMSHRGKAQLYPAPKLPVSHQ